MRDTDGQQSQSPRAHHRSATADPEQAFAAAHAAVATLPPSRATPEQRLNQRPPQAGSRGRRGSDSRSKARAALGASPRVGSRARRAVGASNDLESSRTLQVPWLSTRTRFPGPSDPLQYDCLTVGDVGCCRLRPWRGFCPRTTDQRLTVPQRPRAAQPPSKCQSAWSAKQAQVDVVAEKQGARRGRPWACRLVLGPGLGEPWAPPTTE